MKIENEIFKRQKVNFDKLINYGFIKNDKYYKYSCGFMKNFKVDIYIDNNGNVTGHIIDASVGEEYVNHRIDTLQGEFVNKVREEYKNILIEIANNCFEKKYFITDQANRITKLILETFNDEPEFPWVKYDNNAIFRNPRNQKWYALIAGVDKSKLDENSSGEIEIINLKLNSDAIPSLLKKEEFYPAYHMNKKNWITIILDDTLKDTEIMEYIKLSHSNIE